MSPFSAGIAALFRSALAVDAIYRAGGEGDGAPVRAVVRGPDRIQEVDGQAVIVATHTVDLQVADVAELAEGDTVEVTDPASGFDGLTLEVMGDPRRDSERLVWKAEARLG